MTDWLRIVGSDVLLPVFVKPNRSKSALLGLRTSEGRTPQATTTELEIGLAAPPVDGAANEELVTFLAKCLKIPKRTIDLQSGHQSRHKVVRLSGITTAAVDEALAAAGILR